MVDVCWLLSHDLDTQPCAVLEDCWIVGKKQKVTPEYKFRVHTCSFSLNFSSLPLRASQPASERCCASRTSCDEQICFLPLGAGFYGVSRSDATVRVL